MATLIPPVELSSERVLLRPYCADDVTLVFAAARESVDTVGRWMPWCHAGYTEAESIAWIEKAQAMWQSAEAYEFGMFDSANEYIGGVGINQFNRLHNLANLGYWVRQSRQRSGLATAAVQILAKFGFERLRLTRIEIVAAIENGPSHRVAGEGGRAV